MKILSIIIPTYNMEEYLSQCLDSITDIQDINSIEIIIVNDGSKDSSSQIAHIYESRFPESIVVIDKRNGNYGSCINVGLSIATGKYIRILDSDDWVNSDAFEKYIQRLKVFDDTDLVITDFSFIYSGKKRKKIISYKLNQDMAYDISSFLANTREPDIAMHAITFNLDMLRNNDYHQLEGVFYTDQEWCFTPMIYTKTIRYIDENVYQYRYGRSGQSVDPKVYASRFHDVFLVLRRLMEIYENNKDRIDATENLNQYLLFRLVNYTKPIYRLFLNNPNVFNNELHQLDSNINNTNLELYSLLENGNSFLAYDIKRWRHSRRYPSRLVIFIKEKISFILSLFQ